MGGMYRNPQMGNINAGYSTDKRGNINIQYEDDFSILPEGTYVWDDKDFYFKPGMKWPDDNTQARGNKYKTADKLYKTELSDVYDTVFSWNDYMRDFLTNQQTIVLTNELPDYKVCTESWVDLLAGKPPRVDGRDSKKILSLSNILTNSNFAEAYRSGVRGSQFMYGNKVFRVDKLEGGSIKVVDLPIKCWIPFVNPNDVSTIQVNVIFNIFCDNDKNYYVEFICYYEDGRIKKLTFEYRPQARVLGELIEETDYEEVFRQRG